MDEASSSQPTLKDFLEALCSISTKYKLLGIQIGVEKSEIDEIEAHRSPKERLCEVLDVRLKQLPPLTWDDIDKALRSKTIGEQNLANEILEKSVDKNKPRKRKQDRPCDEGKKIRKLEVIEKFSLVKGYEEEPQLDMEREKSSPRNEDPATLMMDESSYEELITVFKSFFGKLCLAIVDPVDIAGLMLKKELISDSIMLDMRQCSESQVAKTVGLMLGLLRKVQSHPECVVVFIEVLSECRGMQNICNEMLREAGRVCPEECVILKGQLYTKASTNEIIQVASNKSEVLPTQATSVSSCCHIMSKHNLSPVLLKYKDYLLSYYKARDLAAADKYLPTLKIPYINLAIVTSKSYNPQQRDQFTEQTLQGGVDQILQIKEPVVIEDLMKPEKGKPVRFVLIEGPPGIGKSAFAWEMCRKWENIHSLRAYHLVVLLKLREPWVLNAALLSDLFKVPFDPILSKSIAGEIFDSQGKNLLLILDGFDEVSQNIESSIIKSILSKELLPESTIILTTRPSARSLLFSVAKPNVDKHVEIVGFTEVDRVRYITEVFSGETEIMVNFLEYMLVVPQIMSMMYIPLNAAIIAKVYHESRTSCSNSNTLMPSTRTQLFKALVHSLLVRHAGSNASCMLPEGLNDGDLETFKVLARFAFDTYHKNELLKVSFTKEDIPQDFVHFGLMNESSEMYASEGMKRIFSFLHLSLQEYLSAWYIANCYSVEFQVAYHNIALKQECSLENDVAYDVDTSIYKGENEDEKCLVSDLVKLQRYLLEPAIFLAGINGFRSLSEASITNPWKKYLSTARSKNSILLLRSIHEAQNPAMARINFTGHTGDVEMIFDPAMLQGTSWSILFQLHNYYDSLCKKTFASDKHASKETIYIDIGRFSPFECCALSYCIANACFDCKLRIVFRDDTVSHTRVFVKGFNDHYVNTQPPHSAEITLATSLADYSNNTLYWLTKACFLKDITELTFLCYADDSDSVYTALQSFLKLQSLKIFIMLPFSMEWLTALKDLTDLKILHIFSHYPCQPPKICSPLLSEFSQLEEIVLDINLPKCTEYEVFSETDALLEEVLKSFLSLSNLARVVLPYISRATMNGVYKLLLCCPSLTELKLKKTRLGYDGIVYICNALKCNTALTHLVIDDLHFPSFSTPSICSIATEKFIPLPQKVTYTSFLLGLNDILKENSSLQKLNIQSGLFRPLSSGVNGDICQLTGLAPLQQFNIGAVCSGSPLNHTRSYSCSDLTLPKTCRYWERTFPNGIILQEETRQLIKHNFSFKAFFSERGHTCRNSCLSFVSPDTAVLQSFGDIDPRLKEFLIPSNFDYVKRLDKTLLESLNYLQKTLTDQPSLCTLS